MFQTHIKRSRASKLRSTRDRTEASVQLPFDSLGLPKEPLRLSKARRTLALTRAVPCPFGRWTDASTTIHPSDHRDAMALYGQPRIMESA